MNTKQIWIGIAIVAVATSAYFAYKMYTHPSLQIRNDSSAQSQQGIPQNGQPIQVQENPPVTPPSMQTAGKLNIDAVCESALSYMSFPDASSSAAFVADCKLGNHPEVIEHYKAQMNLGDGAAI